ncbi:LysR family transcriptional regulator [Halovulum sp. GXIMD14793]
MEIGTLRLFLIAAQRLSFAATAVEHGTDPTTVSRRIAQLEAELGTRLFHRTTRRMTLTEAGTKFRRDAERILADLDESCEALQDLTSSPRGTLRMTTSVALGQCLLVPLLPDMQARFPELRLDLILTDAKLDLVTEGLDLAIRLGPKITGEGIVTRLFETRYRVCASPDWSGRDDINTPHDLTTQECLTYALPELRNIWAFRDGKERINRIEVQGRVAMTSALALRSAALAGLGPALLADWIVRDDLAAGRLIDLFPEHDVTATEFDTAAWAIYPDQSFMPRKTRAMLDFLKSSLNKN